MASTNGHTLLVETVDTPIGEDAPDVIVPTKFARQLQALTAEFEAPVTLSWNDRLIRAEIGQVTLTGKLVEGQFPDYSRFLPAESQRTVIDPEAFAAAIRRVQLVDTAKTRAVKVDRGQDVVTLSVTSAEGGTADEQLTAECAEAVTTAFDASYLLNMLTAIGGDTIEIHQDTPGSPTLWRRVPADGAVGVVMPMRA